MPHLIVRQPGRMAFSLPLRDGLRVGRAEQNDIVLDDHQVSRQHATFLQCDDGWEVRDMGSRHGTVVNGEKVHPRRVLAPGDRVQIGNVLLDVREKDEPLRIVHQQRTAAEPPPRDGQADRRLVLLYDVSRAVGQLDDTEAFLGQMLDAVLQVLSCDRAFIGLGTIDRGVTRRFQRTQSKVAAEVLVSRSIIEATLGRREAVIVRDAEREAASGARILSAMAAPLGLGAQASGFLYVEDRQFAERFDANDLAFLTALGHMISAALEGAVRLQRAEGMSEGKTPESAAFDLVGKSAAMTQLKELITRYGGAGQTHVLVRGESGSGKELVARAIHAQSPRAKGPFVTLNCAAIPETMVESELFGYEKGAFTGALKAKKGKFTLADEGTLFLDEIGDLALPAQAKLLRAIQEGEIHPLGSERPTGVDVRIVAATHKDLGAEIAAKRFREDLYYRLNVVEIVVPPLRERKEDVALIAAAFLRKVAAAMGKSIEGFTETALAALTRHDWPGNVRELRNEVERAVIHAEGPLVDADSLSPRLGAARPRPGESPARSLAERYAELEPTEKQLVEEAIALAKGNLSEAARLLGITRIMIKRRMEKYGLIE